MSAGRGELRNEPKGRLRELINKRLSELFSDSKFWGGQRFSPSGMTAKITKRTQDLDQRMRNEPKDLLINKHLSFFGATPPIAHHQCTVTTSFELKS
jgi:hypothetical protein